MKRLRDYVNWIDVSQQETQPELPAVPVVITSYCAMIADGLRIYDGLTLAEYVSKLILKDQYERGRNAADLD